MVIELSHVPANLFKELRQLLGVFGGYIFHIALSFRMDLDASGFLCHKLHRYGHTWKTKKLRALTKMLMSCNLASYCARSTLLPLISCLLLPLARILHLDQSGKWKGSNVWILRTPGGIPRHRCQDYHHSKKTLWQMRFYLLSRALPDPIMEMEKSVEFFRQLRPDVCIGPWVVCFVNWWFLRPIQKK